MRQFKETFSPKSPPRLSPGLYNALSINTIHQKNSCRADLPYFCCTSEPSHDKTNKMTMCLAKTQISLGIHPVWSEPSLCAQWIAKDPSFLHADSEDSDQTGRMPRLIWVFAGRTCHFVGFVMRRFISMKEPHSKQMTVNIVFQFVLTINIVLLVNWNCSLMNKENCLTCQKWTTNQVSSSVKIIGPGPD